MSTAQTNEHLDVIPLQTAATLADLFRERIHCGPDALAYRQYDAQGALPGRTGAGSQRVSKTRTGAPP